MQYGGGRREFLLETGKSSDIIYRGQKWLEGIGNESGPFYTSFFEWESGARFHCLRLRAGTSVYPAYSPDCASRLYGVAVSEIAGADLKVFPQPSQGTLIIETIEKLTAIKVFDISGREMPVTVEMSHGQYFLDISRLAAATYILAAETMDGKLLRRVLLRGD